MRTLLTYTLLFFFNFYYISAQNKNGPVAKFSFNDKKDYDEISRRKIKLIGTSFAEDRFGNSDYAVRTFGDAYSYINLGNDTSIKQKCATISLWIKIERPVWSGKGMYSNVILFTRATKEIDFCEAYELSYELYGKKIASNYCFDSIKQSVCISQNNIKLFEWYHFVLTYDNNFQSLYINGKLQRKAVKNFETNFYPGDSVIIGKIDNIKNKRFFDGVVDDVEFYNRVLSDSEIAELYNAPNPVKSKIFLNWALICLIIMAFGGILYLFIKKRIKIAVQKERKKLELANKLLETELRVNRALMNPHFVFNSLNALQNFILKNENDRANNYLVKFSKLMRKILENNMSESISLEMEIDLMQKYLEIEDLRFEENISHSITVDPLINTSVIKIPIMIVQPFIENAIWHGLLKKPGNKTLTIAFSINEQKYLQCVIEDNGLGRKKNESSNPEKKSLGINFVEQRLELFNKMYNLHCFLAIHDKPNNKGTIVIINLPILK